MKRLVSLAVVVAFFVAIPQCFGQDSCQSPAQLLEEQQLVQMFQLAMLQGPGQSDKKGPGCIKCCNKLADNPLAECRTLGDNSERKQCREDVKKQVDACHEICHSGGFDTELPGKCGVALPEL